MTQLARTLLVLVLVGMGGLAHSQVRMDSGLPVFPQARPIDSPFAVDDLWKAYSFTHDGALVDRLITAAAKPMVGLEDSAGQLSADAVDKDPSKHTREDVVRIGKQHLTISNARWSLSYYIVRDPRVAAIADSRRKTATGNEKQMLSCVVSQRSRQHVGRDR